MVDYSLGGPVHIIDDNDMKRYREKIEELAKDKESLRNAKVAVIVDSVSQDLYKKEDHK